MRHVPFGGSSHHISFSLPRYRLPGSESEEAAHRRSSRDRRKEMVRPGSTSRPSSCRRLHGSALPTLLLLLLLLLAASAAQAQQTATMKTDPVEGEQRRSSSSPRIELTQGFRIRTSSHHRSICDLPRLLLAASPH